MDSFSHHDSIIKPFNFYLPIGMLLIDLLIKPLILIGQGTQTFWLGLYYRRAEISALLSSTMQITFAAARFGKRSRTLQAMVVNRWIVQQNIMKESDADAIVVSRYVSDRTSVGWSFPASRERDRWSLVL